MTGIIPAYTRMAYISTTATGGTLDLQCPEGMIQARRQDPGGVLVMAAGQTFSVQKADLPTVGRFFLAAGVILGVDLNDGWDRA